MKNVMTYYIRKRLPALLILTIAITLITVIYLSQCKFVTESYTKFDGEKLIPVLKPTNKNPFNLISIMVCVISTVVPIFEFSYRMTRRSVDLYYSLPLNRKKIFIIRFLLGLFEMFVLLFPQWLITYLWVAGSKNVFTLIFFVWYGLFAFLFAICIYTMVVFFFTRANSLIDGGFFVAFGMSFISVIMNVVYLFLVKGGKSVIAQNYNIMNHFAYSPIFNVGNALYNDMLGDFATFSVKVNIVSLVVFGIMFILCSVGLLFIDLKRANAETVGDISDSWFGYKTMIPIFMVTSYSLLGQFDITWVIVSIGGYMGYACYRKNFRINKWDYLPLAISMTIGITIGILIQTL